MGKTSVALEYVHRYGRDYAGVSWISAESRTILVNRLAELAGALDDRLASTFLPRLSEPPDLEKLAHAGVEKLAGQRKPWLLVYDSVPNPIEIEGLVPGGSARLIITTRYAGWPGWASEIALEPMAPDAAVELLLGNGGGNRAEAYKLAEALGFLPLALEQAAAYLRRTGTSSSRYCARIEELIGKNVGGQASVRATFDLAIRRATSECPGAETILSFLAVLAAQRVPLDLIDETFLPETEREDAFIALTALSLVRHDTFPDETPAVSAHPVVQATARAHKAAADGNRDFIEKAIRRLGEALPDNGYIDSRSAWPVCEKLIPHVLALREHAHRSNIASHEYAFLLDAAANALHGRGAFEPAEMLLKEAVAVARAVLGSQHVDLGLWLNNLANIYMNTARYEQAEPLYREAVEIGTHALGRRTYRVATRISNLANLLMERGQYEEAEGLIKEALETVAMSRGKRDAIYAARLRSLALLLYRTGRIAESETAYNEAISIGEIALGHDHPLAVSWRAQLANILRDTGRLEAAEATYRNAIEHFTKSLGAAHPSVAETRCDLARLLILTGDTEEALVQAQDALSAHERAFGQDHVWTVESAAVVRHALEALGRSPPSAATDISANSKSRLRQ
jgi:tetratricopeptide (TPR) repeat protein